MSNAWHACPCRECDWLRLKLVRAPDAVARLDDAGARRVAEDLTLTVRAYDMAIADLPPDVRVDLSHRIAQAHRHLMYGEMSGAGHHEIEVTPTSLRGVDSGRVRYRVVCLTCQVLVHPATTGPDHMARAHREGRGAHDEPLATTRGEA